MAAPGNGGPWEWRPDTVASSVMLCNVMLCRRLRAFCCLNGWLLACVLGWQRQWLDILEETKRKKSAMENQRKEAALHATTQDHQASTKASTPGSKGACKLLLHLYVFPCFPTYLCTCTCIHT